jgi:hypothetical protein
MDTARTDASTPDIEAETLEDGLTRLLHKLGSLGHAIYDFDNQESFNEYMSVSL